MPTADDCADAFIANGPSNPINPKATGIAFNCMSPVLISRFAMHRFAAPRRLFFPFAPTISATATHAPNASFQIDRYDLFIMTLAFRDY
ncbi:hypothetical protein WK41_32460 [Burkholderia cepacia]|nr:hypothetical protein [Burkholderia cepacia]KVS62435.1 hypothetical protein WK41_32460 [Burkholderia cepacia]